MLSWGPEKGGMMKPFDVREKLSSLADHFGDRVKKEADPEKKKLWQDLYIETMRVHCGFSMLAWGEPGFYASGEACLVCGYEDCRCGPR